jgi:hypothetical protein
MIAPFLISVEPAFQFACSITWAVVVMGTIVEVCITGAEPDGLYALQADKIRQNMIWA